VIAANRLFATLDTRTRRWPIEGLDDVLLSDTVGFVRDLPHHLVASFHATLEEVIEADLILHVVDATDPDAAGCIEAVRDVMTEIGADGVTTLMVINKVDAVADTMQLQALLNSEPGALAISARTGEGLDGLTQAVVGHFEASSRRYRIDVPLERGRAMASLRELADVLESDTTEEAMSYLISVSPRMIGRLRAWARAEELTLDKA
jgi:GTP-binding protein HflX